VAEPQREALVLRIIVTTAEEIRESMTTVLCERLRETLGGPSVVLHSGSLETPVILGRPEILGTIASDLTTEDIRCRQLRSLGGRLQARASYKSIMHTNVTHHHLDTRRPTGKMLYHLGHLPICQHLRMVPRSIPLVPL
jgi:hypothetical protein